jgi:PAS domain S-box-containing protein
MATILIVDDDPNTRELYSALLPPFGHEVLSASDGLEGLKVAQEQRPDLIVSDILMPTMNGYEFVSSLRKLPDLKHTSVIFQSANFLDHESRALGASCGVNEFLSKPCHPESILATINRVLGLPAYEPGAGPVPVPRKDTVSMLVDSFYKKGKELDTVSVRMAELVEFGIQMSQLAAPELLLETALKAARKVIGASVAGAGIQAGDGDEFNYFRVAGLEAAVVEKIDVHNAKAVTFQQIMAEKKAVRACSVDGQPCQLDLPVFHPPVLKFLGVPIYTAEHCYGTIYIANKLGDGEFTDEDELLLGTIAARLAVGYENALREGRLQDQMVQLRSEIERREQAENRFRLLVETSPIGILLCDSAGGVVEANPQVEKMFGYTRHELIGHPVEMLVPESARSRHAGHRSTYLKSAQTRPMGVGMELHARRKDGTQFPVEISLGPLLGPQQLMISCTIVDITERKKLEEQLRVSQRLEAVGQLAAGIAHDFNNILTAILGNAKLALSDLPTGHRAQENLEEINKAAPRATKVVRQILSFSRQEPAKREAIKICGVVEDAIKLLRVGLRANVLLETSIASGMPAIMADSTQVHQIVMNLVTNAADAIGDNQGILKIQLDAVAVDPTMALSLAGLQPGTHIRLSISDNGCGMDESTVRRVFEPFFTTKAPGQGTGLGLSVVHGIVRNHGGAVAIQSVLGQGTTFQIFFPVAAETAAPGQRAAGVEVSRGNGENILYVDDEEPLVFLVTQLLERWGYEVTGCTDPRKALELFQANPGGFDAVLSDLAMPGMSGTELARELLQIRPDIPILISTGYIRPGDNEQVRSLGLPDLILKPDTIDELGRMLQNVFEKRKRSASLETTQGEPGPLHKAAGSHT